MEWVETTGKSVDEAKDAALDRLGIDHDEAEFQVLEEPRAGLFGRMRGEARVRARVAPRVPRPKQERGSRRRGGRERPAAAAGAKPTRAAGAQADAEKPAASAGRRRGKPAASRESTPETAAGADGAPDATEPVTPVKAARAPRPAAKKPSTRPSQAAKPADATTNGSVGATEEGPAVTVSLDEQTTLAEEFLTGLLDAFGLEGELATSRIDESTSEVDITGGDLGLLIGPRGHTISAIQELTRIVLQRHAEGSYEGRVRVDVSGYRNRRREALAKFTTQIAEQVRSSGTRKALEPMNAADRKVIHDTANELEGVHTVSEGEEPRRWVVLVPND